MNEDARERRVHEILRAAGLEQASLAVAGHDRSIAVIGNLPSGRLAEVARIAPEIRGAGFRYVTIDITHSGDG